MHTTYRLTTVKASELGCLFVADWLVADWLVAGFGNTVTSNQAEKSALFGRSPL